MKIGRNDPCPCGSGKKYKKCCLDKQSVQPQTLLYRRLSETHNRLVERLEPLARKIFGEFVVDVALDEFFLWPDEDEGIDPERIERNEPLFWPWFFFNWDFDMDDEEEVEISGPEDRTVAELYAEQRGRQLDTLERKIIESANRKPHTFYEVVHADKGTGIRLQDIFTGSRIDVQERSGSEFVRAGDIVFGRAITVDQVGMLIGLSTTIIPPGHKPEIIEFRKQMKDGDAPITDETLYDWDAEIRELFLYIEGGLHTLPQMTNTDGDPLEFHRLIYQITSADIAFEKLCDLCTDMTSEELLEDSILDDSGSILEVEIPWNRKGHKHSSGMPNTVLGRIMIRGNKLSAEVNSQKRANLLRKVIDARLGSHAEYKLDEIRDIDAMMNDPDLADGAERDLEEQEMLMQNPEIQKQLFSMIMKHWEGWVTEKIPALGGKTPRQAVKTSDGREAVEALLVEAERNRGDNPLMAEANRKGVEKVRKLLGL